MDEHSALFGYFARRTWGGAPAADVAMRSLAGRDTWSRRMTHPDEFLVEAINLAHCGLRPLRRRRHGVMVWSMGQAGQRVVSVRQGASGLRREDHPGEDFYACLFQAAERWGPLPRELLAAFSVDSARGGGLRENLWLALHDRAAGPDWCSGNPFLLCPDSSCRSCDRRG